ncbi:MAG: zinc ABC transporter substrate-binding protein ZnuA [Amphritea sp.]
MAKIFCCSSEKGSYKRNAYQSIGGKTLITTLLILMMNSLLVNNAMADQQKLHVLASVKPIQLIAASLLGDIADVDVLVAANSSPHNYAMKPSDIRRLNSADLVIWAGEDLERFLKKPVNRLAKPALALLDEAEPHEDTIDTDSHSDQEHADEHHHAGDPHFWMSPEQTLEAAEKIAAQLSLRYPDRKAVLATALTAFSQRLAETDQQIDTLLAPIRTQGFYVFHDAYASFTAHYGLNQLGYFTVDPGRKPGARHLNNIRQALETSQARCVFVEPQYTAAVVNSIVGDLPVEIGTLDPLGSQISVNSDAYFHFLKGLAAQFKRCLSAG